MTETEDDIWGDDLLGRREFADFLTKALVARTELISAKEGQRGWTVALDAAWGAGKSFFIKHWADDLRRQGYPVVLFDAWENDIGEEASVALMAEINEEMKQWIGKLPKTKTIERKARALVVDAGRKLRKSVMPVAKVVASGMLQKAIGVGLQEILDSSDKAGNVESNDKPSLASSAEEVLDKVFDVSIQEHQRRKSDIRDFKKALVDLIDLIHAEAGAKYPLFVFIDELDRCRPTYAISMLEEVKHIFGMDKVCFVVSTNIAQIRHSVCSVYGQGFDSESYLKRFFDQSIALPAVASSNYVSSVFGSFGVLASRRHFVSIPWRHLDEMVVETISISWIFSAFGLDVRSQKQVFESAEASASSISKGKIHTIFLFFLCALAHAKRDLFDKFEAEGNANAVCAQALKSGHLNFYRVDREGRTAEEFSLLNIINEYFLISKFSYFDIKREGEFFGNDSIKGIILNELADEFHGGGMQNLSEKSSISEYFRLVRYSGYIRR